MGRRNVYFEVSNSALGDSNTVDTNGEETTDDDDENCVDFSVTNNDSNSDSEDVDYDDEHTTFFMSSPDEDSELKEFSLWLQSVDGGAKSQRSASKHSSVLMGILRYDDSVEVNLANLLNRQFLYRWMNKSMQSGRESGTIKTYLNSVQLYFKFIFLNKQLTTDAKDSISKLKA